jgi:hypothetical protein
MEFDDSMGGRALIAVARGVRGEAGPDCRAPVVDPPFGTRPLGWSPKKDWKTHP